MSLADNETFFVKDCIDFILFIQMHITIEIDIY